MYASPFVVPCTHMERVKGASCIASCAIVDWRIMQLHTVDVEPMTLDEYFGQGRFYFSESKQEAYEIVRMPYPYVVNAAKKLLRDYDDFEGTVLYRALIVKACPSFKQMVSLFHSGISVGYWLGAPSAFKRRTVRANAIKAANVVGVVLKFEDKDDILFMEPEQVPNIVLREKDV